MMDGLVLIRLLLQEPYKSPGYFSGKEMEFLIRAYKERYLALMTGECVKYISVFHNNGRRRRFVKHPHSQIMAIPIIPLDIRRSLIGSEKYYQNHKKCVHCVMLEWKLWIKERIILKMN